MGVLEDLIRIKTNKKDDDLLRLIDEVPVYEKLSMDESLRDLKTSAVTRAKCPLLAGVADGKMYESILADLAANVFLQIEGYIPDVLNTPVDRSEKKQKQRDILQQGITRVEYRELAEYNHEEMSNILVAVFMDRKPPAVTAALVTKGPGGYVMYHGTYMSEKEEEGTRMNMLPALCVKGMYGAFVMSSYSVLGNNGYPFGRYSTKDAVYEVMIGPPNILYLTAGISETAHIIPQAEHNALNMLKGDPEAFARKVTEIIESVVKP